MHKEDSLEEVVRRNSDMVYRLTYSLVRNRTDADDIYQEVFMRYFRKQPKFDSSEHEKAWMIRVTVNCCKNYWKSPWVKHRAAFHEAIVMQNKDLPGENRTAAASDSVTSDQDELLIETVRQLPEKYRVVIHLFYYEEMSVEEIGKVTGTKASTVRTQLTRARKMLRERLGDR